jgi:prepilin-type N-terminal cleavage/methylation domain-containing protein
MIKKNKTGFTLIELLVVIAIISLLSTIVIVSLKDARLKAQDSKTIQQVRQFQTAVAMFVADNNFYPDTGHPLATYVCLAPVGKKCYLGNSNGFTTSPIHDDFGYSDHNNNLVQNFLIPEANAAGLSSYLAYNMIDMPIVSIPGRGTYGGGLIYKCNNIARIKGVDRCTSADVLWATNFPSNKGSSGFDSPPSGPAQLYKQRADEVGGGYSI